MGNSVYNNTSTGYGSSTQDKISDGFASINKPGSSFINFKVGDNYPDIIGRSADNRFFRRNSINSIDISDIMTGERPEYDWVQPVLTSDGVLGGDHFAVYSPSVWEGSTFPAYLAFDDKPSTFYHCANTMSLKDSYLEFYSPVPIRVTNLRLTNRPDPSCPWTPTEGNIYASNDNEEWTNIAYYTNTHTNASEEWNINLTSNNNYYHYYKIEVLKANSTVWSTAEIKITAKYLGELRTAGNYTIFVPEEGSAYISQIPIFRQAKDPTSDSLIESCIWEDTSGYPTTIREYKNGEWVQFSDIPLGQVYINSSGIVRHETYQFNNKYVTKPNGTRPSEVVKSYFVGTEWFLLYADRWLEMGGQKALTTSATTINLLGFTMRNANYNISTACSTGHAKQSAQTVTDFKLTGSAANTCLWRISGYIAD